MAKHEREHCHFSYSKWNVWQFKKIAHPNVQVVKISSVSYHFSNSNMQSAYKNSPVILFAGSNVNILSMRSMANGFTWGKTLASCWRGNLGSCRMYLFASSLRTKPRSDSVGVPRSYRWKSSKIINQEEMFGMK